jgi:hypothetical protein
VLQSACPDPPLSSSHGHEGSRPSRRQNTRLSSHACTPARLRLALPRVAIRGRSLSFATRATLALPETPNGLEPPRAACCPDRTAVSPEQLLQWPPPTGTAVHCRRFPPIPVSGRYTPLREPLVSPTPSPGHVRRALTRISGCAAASVAPGPHCDS